MKATPAQKPVSIDVAVISLDRAKGRRASMRAEFAAAGVEARFHSAVDARTEEGRAELSALPDRGPWGAFQLHDKACTLSHCRLLAEFLEGDADFCLVLEDDVFVSPELGAWLADMTWWPADADIVKVERWRDDRLYVALGRRRLTHLGRRVARLFSKHSGGAGYIVTRSCARTILAETPPDMPIDHLLFNVNISPVAHRLVIYQVTPALTVQGNDPPPDPGAPALPALPWQQENRTLRELRRGWHEVKVIPRLLALAAAGRARPERIEWRAHA